MRRSASVSLYAATCLFTLLIATTNAKDTPYLQPGFSFDYVGSEATVGLPITAQCEKISLKWGRRTKAQNPGPAPVAPYFLQVFSSSSSSPYIIPAGAGPTFDWEVPFAPQTQYQICMYDIFGISGGCQGMRTMVASSSTSVSCQNVTSLPPLAARTSLDDQSKAITQLPVISQCNDFTVTPTVGSPPYTLTIAPSRHPPVNITSTEQKAIPWTVALPEGFPFFASLTSADGLYWSKGPFYVDGTGSTDCLSPGAIPSTTFAISTAGSSVGGLALGAILGAVGMVFFSRCRRRRRPISTMSRTAPSISKPTLYPDGSYRASHMEPPQAPIQYPPTPVFPQVASMPTTPERSAFLNQDPFASTPPPSRAQELSADSIEPYIEVTSPTSSHFPLDTKSRRSQISQAAPTESTPSRTPSLRSYTTYASTSYNGSAYAPSHSSVPLMQSHSSAMSARSSRASRLGRAPTYTRRTPLAHMSAADILMDGDSMIGPGDAEMPPQYMRSPAEEERTVAGGALV
ncbi:hypothetical protein DFP72DRAFT_915974 [Ephemerocybe angulata]|uniref:Uncharacterized protein n=1 Tax=Ephemerocybe angulata TaxID=980116 RepID=A0A8H6M203_9AGAR|nr:hypothetical protein DFP72DRAFT_915974 [Tulosesus angulatus]